MIDAAVLLCTACLEVGLIAGYGLYWVREVREMVLGFCDAMEASST